MLPGVFTIKKTDGSTAYRASITYKQKHISLGTFHSEEAANLAYTRAKNLLESDTPFEESVSYSSIDDALPFEKVIILRCTYVDVTHLIKDEPLAYIGIKQLCSVSFPSLMK